MRIKAVPVIGFRDRIPRPVRSFEIFKNDPGFIVFFGCVTPDVNLPFRRTSRRSPRLLKPRVLVGSVVDNELSNDAESALVRSAEESAEVVQRAVVRMSIKIG